MTDFDLSLLNKFVLHCNIHSDKLTAELKKCISSNFCVNNQYAVATIDLELSVNDLTLTAYPKDESNLELYAINLFESCSFGSFMMNHNFTRQNAAILEDIFSKWIANCWFKAGGSTYNKSVFIIANASMKKIELYTNKSVFKPIVL